MCSDRPRNSSFKLKGLRLGIRKLFVMRVFIYWNRLPGGFADVGALGMFKVKAHRKDPPFYHSVI